MAAAEDLSRLDALVEEFTKESSPKHIVPRSPDESGPYRQVSIRSVDDILKDTGSGQQALDMSRAAEKGEVYLFLRGMRYSFDWLLASAGVSMLVGMGAVSASIAAASGSASVLLGLLFMQYAMKKIRIPTEDEIIDHRAFSAWLDRFMTAVEERYEIQSDQVNLFVEDMLRKEGIDTAGLEGIHGTLAQAVLLEYAVNKHMSRHDVVNLDRAGSYEDVLFEVAAHLDDRHLMQLSDYLFSQHDFNILLNMRRGREDVVDSVARSHLRRLYLDTHGDGRYIVLGLAARFNDHSLAKGILHEFINEDRDRVQFMYASGVPTKEPECRTLASVMRSQHWIDEFNFAEFMVGMDDEELEHLLEKFIYRGDLKPVLAAYNVSHGHKRDLMQGMLMSHFAKVERGRDIKEHYELLALYTHLDREDRLPFVIRTIIAEEDKQRKYMPKDTPYSFVRNVCDVRTHFPGCVMDALTMMPSGALEVLLGHLVGKGDIDSVLRLRDHAKEPNRSLIDIRMRHHFDAVYDGGYLSGSMKAYFRAFGFVPDPVKVVKNLMYRGYFIQAEEKAKDIPPETPYDNYGDGYSAKALYLLFECYIDLGHEDRAQKLIDIMPVEDRPYFRQLMASPNIAPANLLSRPHI